MQIPILFGTKTLNNGDLETVLPLNREPVAEQSGFSRGYLRVAMGARTIATGPGVDRGGINWNDVCYRVMGTKLVKVVGAVVTILGDVGTGLATALEPVRMDYGFDRLAIVSGGRLYYYDGIALTQVTDTDLGVVFDVQWIDGFFMLSDGQYIIVTELNDPTSIMPTKYGSAESDPDPVTGLIKFRGEMYVTGRYTVQVFDNIGGNGFPFQNNKGAEIPRGCVGPGAKVLYADTFAFVGGARGETIGVHLAGSGGSKKISTTVIDKALARVTDLTQITLETRSGENEQRLYLHLPDTSYVFLTGFSVTAQDLTWYEVGSNGPYRIRNSVLVNDDWICADLGSAQIGLIDDGIATHFGAIVERRFQTVALYNQSKGGILGAIELVGMPGRGGQTTIFISFSQDGQTWSDERAISGGAPGQRQRRMVYRPRKMFRNWIAIRFREMDEGLASYAALECDITGLSA